MTQCVPKFQRRAAARIAHEAVCEATQSDGFGHCAEYAVAGCFLLCVLTKKRYVVQIGSLQIVNDPASDQCFTCDASDKGWQCGEFHAWVIGPAPDTNFSGWGTEPCDLIDFSARHYRRMAENLVTIDGRIRVGDVVLGYKTPNFKPLQWRRPDPPDYVWCRSDQIPDWLGFAVEPEGTQDFVDHLDRYKPLFAILRRRIAQTNLAVRPQEQ